MSKILRGKGTVMLAIQAMIAGLTKHFAGQTLTMNGVAVKVDDATARLAAFVVLIQAAASAEAAWKLALSTMDTTAEGSALPLMSDLRLAVKSAMGSSNPMLVDFGLKPLHVAVRTAEEQVAANQKSQATREARKTMGKKQKEKVHGTVAVAAPADAPAKKP